MPPRTYYQILQVDSEASPEVIEAAYRRLARMYHPDVNSAPDALTRMQEVNQAYDVLKHPDKRSSYDAQVASTAAQRAATDAYHSGTRTQATSQPSQPNRSQTQSTAGRDKPAEAPRKTWDFYAEPHIPIHCERCGRSDSSLRLAAFPYVVSLIIVTSRQSSSGLYCHQCRVAEMTAAKAKTAVFGWWGIPFGPIYSLGCLFTPSDGKVPADVNGPYLGALGLHFLKAEQIGEGIEALQASLGYQHNREVADLLSAAEQYQFKSTSSASATNGSATRAPARAPNYTPVKRQSEGRRVWVALAVIGALLAWLWWTLRPISQSSQYMTAQATVTAAAMIAPTPKPTATTLLSKEAPPAVAPSTVEPSISDMATRVAAHLAGSSSGAATMRPAMELATATILRNQKLHSGPGATYAQSIAVTVGQVLSVVAQQDNCAWLQVQNSSGEGGWVHNDQDHIKWDSSCDLVPLGVYRPKTRALTRSMASNSYGILEVENGTLYDSVVIMIDTDSHLLASAYIRAGDTYKLTRIPDGSHKVFFTSGSDWNGSKFTSNVGYTRFDDPIPFETTSEQLPGWSLTLQPVEGGNAETTNISEAAFPPVE